MSTSQDHELDQWLRASRTEDAARSRRRTAAWFQHGPVDACLIGVALDMAGRGAEARVTVIAGHDHCGRILGVGSSWVLLARHSGDLVLIRSRCVASIGSTDPQLSFGARTAASPTGFASVLEQIAIDRIVAMRCGDAIIHGELLMVGDDLAMVAIDGRNRRYVSLAAVDEATVPTRS